MVNRVLLLFVLILLIGGVSYDFYVHTPRRLSKQSYPTQSKSLKPVTTASGITSPLAISTMRMKAYPGSAITFEQTLKPGSNYNQYLVSYLSDGYKIYGLLTIPVGKMPVGGWPVILFNHGYIPPASYATESSYFVMVAPLAQAGYIVFKPDYRGNGSSQGTPSQPYISPVYITDSMNALSSIEKEKDVNPQRIGVFGHSMGGNITLHELVMTNVFKAAELMAGVVGNETAILQWWQARNAAHSIIGNDLDTWTRIRQMEEVYGTVANDPAYWHAIDPTQFIGSINTPVQIQVGTADDEVPPAFSLQLYTSLQNAGKVVSFQTYPGADHNLSPDLSSAMQQSVSFFNKYLR